MIDIIRILSFKDHFFAFEAFPRSLVCVLRLVAYPLLHLKETVMVDRSRALLRRAFLGVELIPGNCILQELSSDCIVLLRVGPLIEIKSEYLVLFFSEEIKLFCPDWIGFLFGENGEHANIGAQLA